MQTKIIYRYILMCAQTLSYTNTPHSPAAPFYLCLILRPDTKRMITNKRTHTQSTLGQTFWQQCGRCRFPHKQLSLAMLTLRNVAGQHCPNAVLPRWKHPPLSHRSCLRHYPKMKTCQRHNTVSIQCLKLVGSFILT